VCVCVSAGLCSERRRLQTVSTRQPTGRVSQLSLVTAAAGLGHGVHAPAERSTHDKFHAQCRYMRLAQKTATGDVCSVHSM